MTEFHASVLRGEFLTHVARGDSSIPLALLLKTAHTYVRKGYVTAKDLGAILDDVQSVGVRQFKTWHSQAERNRRFQALTEGLSVVLAESSA